MGRNRAQRVVLHGTPTEAAEGVDRVYAGYVRRRLEESGLDIRQQVEVLDRVIARLREEGR